MENRFARPDAGPGRLDLQSGSGDMKISRLAGEIRLQTGSGNVQAREIAGPVRGGAGSGDIEVEETGAGDIDLHTGSGNITARGVDVARARFYFPQTPLRALGAGID